MRLDRERLLADNGVPGDRDDHASSLHGCGRSVRLDCERVLADDRVPVGDRSDQRDVHGRRRAMQLVIECVPADGRVPVGDRSDQRRVHGRRRAVRLDGQSLPADDDLSRRSRDAGRMHRREPGVQLDWRVCANDELSGGYGSHERHVHSGRRAVCLDRQRLPARDCVPEHDFDDAGPLHGR